MNITIDLFAKGFNKGHFYCRATTNWSAYRIQKIPIFSACSEVDGPTILIVGGFHGDEYEGQLASRILIDRLVDKTIRLNKGNVIIVPSLNLPACESGFRFSPYDYGGKYKISVGSVDGVTQKIFDFYERTLLKLSDVCIDLHSGGKSLKYAPLAITYRCDDEELNANNKKLIDIFSAPYSMIRDARDLPCSSFEMAEVNNALYLATELGGGGGVDQTNVNIGLTGIYNILTSYGMITNREVHNHTSKYLYTNVNRDHVFSESKGMFLPYISPGEYVVKGQIIGIQYSLQSLTAESVRTIESDRDAIVVALRALSETDIGDCLFEYANPISDPLGFDARYTENA